MDTRWSFCPECDRVTNFSIDEEEDGLTYHVITETCSECGSVYEQVQEQFNYGSITETVSQHT